MVPLIAHVDFETRSAIDLPKNGVYRYAMDPSTDIWVLGYRLGDGPVMAWVPGDPVPEPLAEHICSGGLLFAHNAMGFERVIWHHILTPRYGFPEPALEQWRCTAAMAAAMALPRSLEAASTVMGLPVRKDMAGHNLMLRMAKPRRVWNLDEMAAAEAAQGDQ